MTTALLLASAFCAGIVEAMVGGGGLIQLPAMLVLLPQYPHPVVFGTNKLANVLGTLAATYHYVKAVSLPRRMLTWIAGFAVAGSFGGALCVSMLNPAAIKPLIVILLTCVALYTFVKKDLGAVHAPKLSRSKRYLVGALLGTGLGFYDGFLGPGTGSFLIFGFVVLFGFDFLTSSACAKVINVGSNLAAIVFFVSAGEVDYGLALMMGAANISGALIGSRLALRGGATLVRRAYLVIVSLLILRLGWSVVAG